MLLPAVSTAAMAMAFGIPTPARTLAAATRNGGKSISAIPTQSQISACTTGPSPVMTG